MVPRRYGPSNTSWFAVLAGTTIEAVGAFAFAVFLYVLIERLSHQSDFLIPGQELHTAVGACLIGCTLAVLLLPALMSGWSSAVRTFALFTAVGLIAVLSGVHAGALRDPATTSLPDFFHRFWRLGR